MSSFVRLAVIAATVAYAMAAGDTPDSEISLSTSVCTHHLAYVNFSMATVTTNNIDGKGPDNNTNEYKHMRLSNVGYTPSGVAVDLLVSTFDSYSGDTSQNGVNSAGFLTVNVASNTSTYLRLLFVRAGTNEREALMRGFVLTLDARYKEAESSSKYGKYVVANDTEVGVTDKGNGSAIFTATKKNEVGNPTNPIDLSPQQLERVISLYFYERAEADIRLTVEAGGGKSGRTFAFDSFTPLGINGCDPLLNILAAPPPAPSSSGSSAGSSTSTASPAVNAACTHHLSFLDFTTANVSINNLNGGGPDGGNPNEYKQIRVNNVGYAPSGVPVDLMIWSPDGSYQASDPSANGIDSAGFLSISVAARTTANLRFKFVRSGTNVRCELMRGFVFSMYDFDGGKTASSIYFNRSVVSNDTLIKETVDADGNTTFSSPHGSGNFRSDKSLTPMALNDAEERNTVALYFYERSEVQIALSVSGSSGRTFLISDETPFGVNGCNPTLEAMPATSPPPAAASV